MEKYNYTYEGRAITKKTFEDSVPKDWTKDYDEIKGVKVGDTFEYRGKDSFGLHEFGPDYERWGRVGGLTGFTLAEEDMADFYGWCRVLAKDSE